MKNKILIPTDFSENALFAAQYACRLAQQNDASVTLYHCYTAQSSNFDSEELAEKFEDDKIFKADLLIEELRNSLILEFSDLTIETTCERGLLIETLPLYVKKEHIGLIVMGTTGRGNNKSIVWGSNTSQISAQSPVPVIAIPNKHAYFKLEKAAILTNFKSEELETLKDFLNLFQHIQHLEIIHVIKDEKNIAQIKEKLASWEFIVQDLNGIEQVSSTLACIDESDKELDTIPEVINSTINKEDFDMIVVTKTRKSFFERLFRKSVSKELTLNLRKPTFFDNN